jgi:hypothetical protein
MTETGRTRDKHPRDGARSRLALSTGKHRGGETWPIIIHPRSPSLEPVSRTRPVWCPTGAIHVLVTLSNPITCTSPCQCFCVWCPVCVRGCVCVSRWMVALSCNRWVLRMHKEAAGTPVATGTQAPCRCGAYCAGDAIENQASWAKEACRPPGAPRGCGWQGVRDRDLPAVACTCPPHTALEMSTRTGHEATWGQAPQAQALLRPQPHKYWRGQTHLAVPMTRSSLPSTAAQQSSYKISVSS